jgi:hypothetical protein
MRQAGMNQKHKISVLARGRVFGWQKGRLCPLSISITCTARKTSWKSVTGSRRRYATKAQ